MTNKDFSSQLYNRYGTVTRARDCFLYTKKGTRLVDLYQENGRAILGWSGDNAFTMMKNAMNKGICGSFITEDSSRVEKALSSLFSSDRVAFYFSSKKDAVECALLFSKTSTSVWKPWNPENTDCSSIEAIVFAPTLPWTDSIYITAVSFETYKKNQDMEKEIKNEIQIPFPLKAAIARSIYNLIQALQTRKETDWFIYDTVLTKYWTRKGPYLFPKVPQEKYDDFVIHCLNCGLAINPDYNKPSIVPFGADKGVFTKLKNMPFNF